MNKDPNQPATPDHASEDGGSLPPLVGQLNYCAEAHDPKLMNTKCVPVQGYMWCKDCKKPHSRIWDCPHISFEKIKAEMERSLRAEKWARGKAASHLNDLQKALGKIAILKHENNQLRRKLTTSNTVDQPPRSEA